MKRGLFLISILLLFSTINLAVAQENKTVDFYLFYGDGCPHCAREKEWLEDIAIEYPFLKIYLMEVYNDQDNANLYRQFAAAYGSRFGPVPATFIGDESFLGFSSTISQQMEDKIEQCYQTGCEILVNFDEPVAVEELPVEQYDYESMVGLTFIALIGFAVLYFVIYKMLINPGKKKKTKKK